MPDLSSSLRDLIERSSVPIDVDAIVGARRRRRLRKRVGIAGAVLVIAVVATGSVLARPASEHKSVVVAGSGPSGVTSEADATQAALADLSILSPGVPPIEFAVGGVSVTDPRSGATRGVPFPVRNVRSPGFGHPVVRGSNVVFLLASSETSDASSGSAYVVNSTLDQWRSIGSASSVIASLDPARVWRGTSDSVVEQTVDGRNVRSYPRTNQRTPLAAVTGGLLTTRPGPPNSGGEILELWEPSSNREVRRFPNGSYLVGAAGDYAVWDACANVCVRHVTDLRSDVDIRLLAPPNMDWGLESAFSPDGRQLALFAHTPLTRQENELQGPGPPAGTHPSIVSVIDLASGKRTERRLMTWKGETALSWSPDGSLLFFARTDHDVDYFNAAYANSPLHELAVPGANGFLLVRKPAPASDTQRYAYDGLISQSAQHSAELCVYPAALVATPGGNGGCSGPAIAGWDWSRVDGETTTDGVISGKYHVVGTYDGDVFTLTEPPSAAEPRVPGALPNFKTPCAAPAGGWQITDPARLTLGDYNAVTNTARDAPDFAGLWLDSSTAPPGSVNDFSHEVFNIAFTGDIDAHSAALAALWGGPICVVQRPYPYSELKDIADSLFGAAGRELGLQMLGAGPDDARDVVQGDAVAVSPEMQRAIDRRFGKGLVQLRSVLRPLA